MNLTEQLVSALNEAKFPTPNKEAKKFLKGKFKIDIEFLKQLIKFAYYDKETKKWWFVDSDGDVMELRNEYTLKELNYHIKRNSININE